MRNHLLFSSALLSVLAATAGGCGNLDGHTGTQQPLATIQGSLDAQGGFSAPGNDVRIAVVWIDAVNGFSVSEDLPIQPVFPSSFVIQLTAPPPASAMITESSIQVAQGVVVAYEDLNGNGKLDLVAADAGQFIDKIVGANPSMDIVYVAGTIPADLLPDSGQVGTPQSGYNLFQMGTCVVTPDAGLDEAGAHPLTCDSQWFPMSTPYDLTVSESPKQNEIMCQGYGAGTSGEGSGGSTWYVDQNGTPPGGYPAAGAQGLVCDGQQSYVFTTCADQQLTLCTDMEVCDTSSVALGSAAPPAGWPCP